MEPTNIETLAQSLSLGFEALLVEVNRQREIEKTLKERLRKARSEYEAILRETDIRDASRLRAAEELFADRVEGTEFPSVPLKAASFEKPEVARAMEACKTLKYRQKKNADSSPQARQCPVIHGTNRHAEFEQDFTTPGVKGSLECPFAKMMTNNPLNAPDSTLDPVAAEFHPDKVSIHSASLQQPKCPIRFLDQHSPEEMAKYFENHKHEIPRSHEICVKRYQQNESSIRELDAKYGNLVSMIQGLGVKHKQFLPDQDSGQQIAEKGQEDHRTKSSDEFLAIWAANVSERANAKPSLTKGISDHDSGINHMGADQHEERVGHFEKPLREIRVGESPSRPWGIPVPADKGTARSGSEVSSSSPKGTGDLAYVLENGLDYRNGIPRKTPQRLGSSMNKEATGRVETRHENNTQFPTTNGEVEQDRYGNGAHGSTGRPSIVFSGPVIIGYAPEQAVEFLDKLKGL